MEDDTRLRLAEIQESLRRFEKRQKSIRIAAWIAAVCGIIVCLAAAVEFSVVVWTLFFLR